MAIRYPRFPATVGELIPIEYNKFSGYNIADDAASLPPGFLVEGSRDIDLTRYIGSLAKRLGLEAQIASLGAGGIKGIHTYRASSGDIPLFGWSTTCKKLSGQNLTLTKTTKADWDAGTLTNIDTDTSSGDMKTIDASAHVQDQDTAPSGGGSYYTLSSTNTMGQTFTTGSSVDNITKIVAASLADGLSQWGAGEEVTLTIYTDTGKGTSLGSKTLTFATKSTTFTFDAPIALSASTQYYVEFSMNTGTLGNNILVTSSSQYAGGAAYNNGVSLSSDMDIVTYYYYRSTSAEWESSSYDLASTPTTATIAWTVTTPATTSLTWYVQGSEDDQNWGDWQTIAASGDGIPRTRYVKVKVAFVGTTIATATVSQFVVTYASAFDTATNIKTGLSGNTIRFVDYEGSCYFTESGRPQRYDGTNQGNVGIDAPGAPTVATGAAGLPNGAYYCKVTILNSYGAESNGGTVSAVVNPVDQKIEWTAIPTGGTWATARKLYRRKPSDGIYYLVTTINDNTTTTYSDNLSDAELLIPLVTTNDIPPNASIIHAHKDYMLYVYDTDKTRLYYSKRGLPDNVNPNAYKSFPGDITAVGTYQDACVVGGKGFTAVVFGDTWDPDTSINNTTTRVISDDEGPLTHESMKQCFAPDGDILVFPTVQGLRYLTPGLQENSMRSIPLSRAVQKIFKEAKNTTNLAAIYHNDRLLLAMCWYGSDTPVATNNVIMVYDFRTGQWCPPWYIASAGFCIANNRLYIGSPSIGRIYEMEKGTSDAGSNIHSIAKLRPEYTPLGMGAKKQFVQAAVAVLSGSDTTNLNLKATVDNGTEATVAVGATSTWNDGLKSPPRKLNVPRGYRLNLTIDDDGAVDWVIPNIALDYERGA